MYTIAGATGRVGSVAAQRLLDRGAPVRVLVRDEAKAAAWSARGAEVAVVDLTDRVALAAALQGSDGAFLLLPFDLATDDFDATTETQIVSMAVALAVAEVPHVTVLSSAGADLPEGTGPIVGLHRLERALRETGTTVSAIRSGHFQEKVADLLDAARHDGVYPVFADSADDPKPMIATVDIGAAVADALLAPPAASEVIDLDGPVYTERQVAGLLGDVLGRELEIVTIPQAGWADALIGAGFSPHIAEVLTGLYDADQRGLLAPRGDRTVPCTTRLESTLASMVGVPAR